MEAEKAEVAAADLSLEAAIKRRSDKTPVISATLVGEDDEAAAEKKFTQQQTKVKLSAVKSRLNKLVKKDVVFKNWDPPASPAAGKRQQRAAQPGDMIEGWDPPTSDGYLSYRIAAAITQVGNASVNNQTTYFLLILFYHVYQTQSCETYEVKWE